MKQNTPEWLEMRRSKIGASDAAIILGISPWKTPFELWEEKVLGKEQEQSGAMARGHAMEEEARYFFERETSLNVMPKVVVHPDRDWQMASLDGITFDGSVIVEIKCPNKEVHEKARLGEVPDHYYAQIQHQLAVTGAMHCFYFSYDGKTGHKVMVNPDEKYIKKMIKEEERFYQCMINKEPPEMSEKDYIVRDDIDWTSLVKEYKEVKAELDILRQCEEGIRDKIVELADKKNSIGHGLKLTRSMCKGQVDYKLVPELMGVDLEPYRKPSCEKWRITLKEEI
jgi:putative phage-type endonuclease